MKNVSRVSNHRSVMGKHPRLGITGNLIFIAGMECIKMAGGVLCAALLTLIVGL